MFLTNSLFSQDITSGLALRYTFSNATNNIVSDESANNYSAILRGNATISNKDNNTTLSLDGGENNYLEIINTNNPGNLFGSLSEFTISAWVYINANSTWCRIFDFGSGTNNYLFLAPQGGSGNVRYAIKYNGTEVSIDGSSALAIGEWVHVAVSYSGSTARIYVNSVLDGQGTIPYSPATLGTNNYTQNYLGKSQWPDPYFNGNITDFRIYDRALSPADINELILNQLRTSLQSVIDVAEAYQNPSSELTNGIVDAQTILANATSASELELAIENLNDIILQFEYNSASPSNPYDITYKIVNPSFESYFEGWTNIGMASQTNTAFPLKDGNIYVEKWVTSGSQIPNVSVQQTITGLPTGFYSLTVAAGLIQQSGAGGTPTGAHIFAGDNTTAVDTFGDRSVDFFLTNETVTIGLKAENASGNWLSCDNYRLQYKGFDIADAKTYLQDLIDAANALLPEKINDGSRTELVNAIDYGEQTIANSSATQEEIANAIQLLIDKTKNAQASIDAYNGLQDAIDEATIIYGDGSGNEAVALQDATNTAINVNNDLSVSTQAVNDAINDLNLAIFKYQLANPTDTAPTVVTKPNYARGATMAFGRSTITGIALTSLKEHGFCWSTNENPSITDNRTTKYFTNNGNIYHLENLEPSTVYYMRAYALTNGNAVGYGEVVKFITIPKGTVSYSLRSGMPGDVLTRIDEAMSTAVRYFNDLTSIQGHHLSAGYSSGVPTAEASYGGYMTFGPNASYQRTGTALHEMGHTIGVGTHSIWYGPSSPLRETGSSGLWLGNRTDAVIQFIENNTNSHLTGDSVHMWPYGINGAQEDNGSEFLYIANALVHQALGEDGLPPTGTYATPSYTLKLNNDTAKYYIKSEGISTGRNTAFIAVNDTGNLVNEVMTPDEALNNDKAAWHINFNPTNSYYTIKNVATGSYFTYKTTGANGFGTATRTNPASNDYFQMMQARVETTVTVGSKTYTGKGYWIIHPESQQFPTTFSATSNTTTTTSSFNIANSATFQRWLLMDSEEVQSLSSLLSVEDESLSTLKVYPNPTSSNLTIQGNDDFLVGAKLNIYDITGRIITSKKLINNTAELNINAFPSGIYLMKITNNGQTLVKRISKK
ncbi:LamG-like jellyroll fold domain-containing protein [Flavobacteriaceae bacterium SZ-1-7]|uniref:LamG-like jellyroll fold domain-containing protein n=1 Tax=Tamlana sedimenti TaxID=3134126 RepID=UPI00312A062E